MKEVSRTGKNITLKCETAEDFKSMVESMRVQYICGLSDKRRLAYLRSIRLGVFTITLQTAIKNLWVDGRLTFLRMLSPLEIKILNSIYDHVSRTATELYNENDKAISVINDNVNRLRTDGYVEKITMYKGEKGRPKVMYKLTGAGSRMIEHLKSNSNSMHF